MLTQMSIKAGMQKFSEMGSDALPKEMNQLRHRHYCLRRKKTCHIKEKRTLIFILSERKS